MLLLFWHPFCQHPFPAFLPVHLLCRSAATACATEEGKRRKQFVGMHAVPGELNSHTGKIPFYWGHSFVIFSCHHCAAQQQAGWWLCTHQLWLFSRNRWLARGCPLLVLCHLCHSHAREPLRPRRDSTAVLRVHPTHRSTSTSHTSSLPPPVDKQVSSVSSPAATSARGSAGYACVLDCRQARTALRRAGHATR